MGPSEELEEEEQGLFLIYKSLEVGKCKFLLGNTACGRA
jgi:hypothetical protein